MTPDKEIAIGLQSAPQMAQQHGGLHPNTQYQTLVDNVGNKLIHSSIKLKEDNQLVLIPKEKFSVRVSEEEEKLRSNWLDSISKNTK